MVERVTSRRKPSRNELQLRECLIVDAIERELGLKAMAQEDGDTDAVRQHRRTIDRLEIARGDAHRALDDFDRAEAKRNGVPYISPYDVLEHPPMN